MGLNADGRSLLLHFSRNDLESSGEELLILERGEGCHLYDQHHNRYVDGLSALFCAQIGYSHGPEMARAAATQLHALPYASSWGAAHPTALQIAERLTGLAPAGLDHAFLTCGGSESVEAAWKLARMHHHAKGETQRTKAIARHVAYHGVTLGALAFTGVPKFKIPFDPPAIDVRHVANTGALRSGQTPDERCRSLLAELEQAIVDAGPEQVAALIAEPVQNAGGCLVPPPGYWAGLRELCDRYGIVMIADEVITGCGRLGEWFASTREGVKPDLITLAKGLTSAYAPMGAVVVGENIAATLHEQGQTLLHGVTFGGHPLSAAIAIENIEIFSRERVLENVKQNAGYLQSQLETLRRLPIVGDVRGEGYFWALELVADAELTPFAAAQRDLLIGELMPRALRDAGLIARADARGEPVLHIAPPLVADRPVIDELTGRAADALTAAEAALGDTSAMQAASA